MTTRLIAAIGMFDGVHLGHRFLIDFAKGEGAKRSLKPAVVTFRDHPMRLIAPERAPLLIMSCEDKLKALQECGVEVIMLDFDEQMRNQSAEEFIKFLHENYAVDCLIIGYDHRFGHNRSEGFDDYRRYGEKMGVEILRAPQYSQDNSEVSSSAVRRLISEGRIEAILRLIGRDFTLGGRVVPGRQLGRRMGFPTANLEVSKNLLVPRGGVYAANAILPDGSSHRAILNIGTCPTVDSSADSQTTIEVHIINFSGNLYDSFISVQFLARLRDEKRFESLEALTAQIQEDRARALAL